MWLSWNWKWRIIKTFIARNPNEVIKETEFYKSYKSWFDGLTEVVNLKKRKSFTDLPKADQEAKLKSMFFDLVLEIETEKFFFFLLTHRIEEDPENFAWYDDQTEDGTPLKVAYPQQKAVPQKMLIVKTGSTNKEQEKFLGYKFSNRRGYKGIDFTGDTLMFNQADQLNPKKVNSYIYKNFVDEKIKVDEELADNLSLVRLTDCINFEKIDFDKRLNLSAESFADPKDYKWPTKAFKYVLQPITGSQTKIEKTEWKETGDIPVISQEKDFISGYVSDVEPVTDLPVIVFGDHTTIFKYIDFQFVRGADGVKLFKPIVDYIPKAFYYICQTLDIPASQKYTRHYKYLSNVKIPIPTKDIQQKIITEIEAIEAKEARAKKVIEERHLSIKSVVNELFENNSVSFKIKQYFDINRDSIDPKTEYGETEFTYVDIDSVGKGDGNISFDQKVIGNNAASRAKRVAKNDTVIVSTVRPYLKGFAYLEKEVENTVYSTGFALINTKDEKKYITKLLFYYFMYSDNLMKQMEAKMPKASYPSINKGDIEAFVIPSITITEQKKALSELDKLEKEIQKQEQAIANTEEEKKAVLTKYLEK